MSCLFLLVLLNSVDTSGVRLTTEDFAFSPDRQLHFVVGSIIGSTLPFAFDRATQNCEQGLILEGQKFIWGLWLTSMVAVKKEIWDWKHGGRLDLADFSYTVLGYVFSYSLNRALKYVFKK